ncbi:uncharacterized protein KY384_002411 [Bacidia gigantensis]|uniref:uncharacterized protein n=1 Tax=Bacidia gigantensis TaxID=2732470 RepID=UPI001D05998A|nr:uncharacterized protein KY384_002411 [Bacidia gigantensis]KAG8532534.1 hypothetical protein KY384_002411 [Bacidia gigantensis]
MELASEEGHKSSHMFMFCSAHSVGPAGLRCFKLTHSRVVAAALVRIVELTRTSEAQGSTLEAWSVVLCALVEESLGVVAACIPYLKPFLDNLESGMMNNDLLRREGLNDLYDHCRSGVTLTREAEDAAPIFARARSPNSFEHDSWRHDNSMSNVLKADVITCNNDIESSFKGNVDGQPRCTTNIIRKTTTLTLTSAPCE